jgi:hypothetical protein
VSCDFSTNAILNGNKNWSISATQVNVGKFHNHKDE